LFARAPPKHFLAQAFDRRIRHAHWMTAKFDDPDHILAVPYCPASCGRVESTPR